MDLVERIAADRTLRSVEDAADAFGTDLRTLQRLRRCEPEAGDAVGRRGLECSSGFNPADFDTAVSDLALTDLVVLPVNLLRVGVMLPRTSEVTTSVVQVSEEATVLFRTIAAAYLAAGCPDRVGHYFEPGQISDTHRDLEASGLTQRVFGAVGGFAWRLTEEGATRARQSG